MSSDTATGVTPASLANDERKSLDAYVETAFDLLYRTADHHYRWTLAGMTWALTGDSLGLERYMLPSLGSDIQLVDGPPAPGTYHIHCVDSGATRHRIHPPQCTSEGDNETNDARRIWLNDNVRVAYQVREDILMLADMSRIRALVQVPSLSDLPYYEKAKPIRDVFHWFMSGAGLHLLHAAVIGREDAGVLLPGRSGSGKSSVALAGLMAGMHYVGDDMVLVDQANSPRAYGLYTTVNVVRADLHHGLPVTARILNSNGPPSDKAVFRLHPEPYGFRSGIPLKALLVPCIGGSTMSIEPCSGARALSSLAPSTLMQMAGEREQLFAQCARLARQLPAFILHTGPRTERYPEDISYTINRLLDEIA